VANFAQLLGAIALLVAAGVPIHAQPKLLQPVNLGDKVNTKFDETDPFLLPDNLRLFYASNASGDFDLMVAARKKAAQAFEEAIPVKQVNKLKVDTRSPFYYAPLKEFYFASNRIPDDGFKDDKNFDIFVSAGAGAPFAILGVNTPVDEMFPWITANGAEMFFSRKTKEGWRQCVTKGPKVGAPDKGKILEEFSPNIHHATVSPDGLTMYLEGPLSTERTGLFRSTRKKVGAAWEKPKALVNLNHPDAKRGEMSPSLNSMGTVLFFASDRPGGQGGLDLYSVAVAELKTE
jgi:hypothetical protein